MSISILNPMLAMLTGLALLLGAASQASFAATEKAKPAAKAKPVSSAKFLPGSQETAKERTLRLKRECKGSVNAGACAGYTQ